MPLKTHTNTDRAVSPVIGIILMVAIVILLSAIISSYAFGIVGSLGASPPTDSFHFSYNNSSGDVLVSLSGGKTLNGNNLRFAGAALEKDTFGNISEWAGHNVHAGDSARVNVEGGKPLKLIWKAPHGTTTATLATYSVPASATAHGSVHIQSVQSITNTVHASIGHLSRISADGTPTLVVKTARGTTNAQPIHSNENISVPIHVHGTTPVTATLYESGTSGRIASDSKSAHKQASISRVSADHMSANVHITNLQFNGTTADTAYVVVTDADNQINTGKSVQTTGSNLNVTVPSNYYISAGERITVSVYETRNRTNKLTTRSTTAT